MSDIVGVTCWVTNRYGGDPMRIRAYTEEHGRNSLWSEESGRILHNYSQKGWQEEIAQKRLSTKSIDSKRLRLQKCIWKGQGWENVRKNLRLSNRTGLDPGECPGVEDENEQYCTPLTRLPYFLAVFLSTYAALLNQDFCNLHTLSYFSNNPYILYLMII